MLKDITLGQFFPGSSPIHRVDPRTKLICLTAFIVALFMAKGWAAYVLCIVAVLAAIGCSRVALSLIYKGLKPIFIIVIFTAVLNLLYTPGEVLASVWIIKITHEGIERAIYMTLRIVMLVMATSLLTYTTSPIALTDGIETLFAPLKKIRVPVHEFAMMMTIALRFIPTLIEETDKIMSAQKARGADFETGNLIARARALIPVLVPLFLSAFRRADELAVAMECRLYRGGVGRTRLNQLHYKKIDVAGFSVGALVCGGIVALRYFPL